MKTTPRTKKAPGQKKKRSIFIKSLSPFCYDERLWNIDQIINLNTLFLLIRFFSISLWLLDACRFFISISSEIPFYQSSRNECYHFVTRTKKISFNICSNWNCVSKKVTTIRLAKLQKKVERQNIKLTYTRHTVYIYICVCMRVYTLMMKK